MRRTAIVGLLGAVLCLAGCIFFGPFGPEILYEESTWEGTPWYQGENDSRKWWVEGNKYHVLVKKHYPIDSHVAYQTYRTSVGPFADFRLTIDLEQVIGPDNNGYGVMFRVSQDAKDFYRFLISGDGYVNFIKAVDGAPTTIFNWTPSTLVNKGNAANQVTIVANGNLFTFYVNGELLHTIADSTFDTGYVGLSAIKFVEEGGELQITFDNLRIEALE